MVEDKGRDSPVHVSGRAFIGSAQTKVGEHTAVVAWLDRQGWCHWITYTDNDIAPRHLVAVAGEPNAIRTVDLLAAQSRCGRVDLGLGCGNRVGADLGADGRVDQRPHGLGE